jgi:hypothetical protein
VRRATQALRIRDRQQEAWGKKRELQSRNKEIEGLKKQVRAAQQAVHVRESVLTQTIDMLKRDKVCGVGGCVCVCLCMCVCARARARVSLTPA